MLLEFPLYSDAEIGFDQEMVVKSSTQDEDLDTDEDVMFHAKNRCSADFLQTRRLLPPDRYERDKLIR